MKQKSPIRGVNLGGWLVLEKWMTPSLFEGLDAKDEFELVRQPNFLEKLKNHKQDFITEADFQWMKQHNINAVRLPIGFWALDDEPPLLSTKPQIDWTFEMAEKYDLKVLLCLHAARGSQNGDDHSGRTGKIGWYRPKNIKKTTQALRKIAKTYQNQPAFWGLELLNEPKTTFWWQKQLLLTWTRVMVQILSMDNPNLKIVYSDAFETDFWNQKTKAILDVHHYQCFSEADKNMSFSQHLEKIRQLEPKIQKWKQKQPVIIGEWSLGLDPKSIGDSDRQSVEKAFAKAQINSYSAADGWFFWNYKTETEDGWNFRHLVESGVIAPEDLI